MKIALLSDAHLEFGPLTINNDENADVLILAGDICVAAHFTAQKPDYVRRLAAEYRQFFDHITKEFPHIVYCMGNHEHYQGDIAKTYSILKQNLDYPNLHILEKETWHHQGHTFIGGTLWTDMDDEDLAAMDYAGRSMTEFREVFNSTRMVVRNVPVYQKNPDWTPDGRNGGQYLKNADGSLIGVGYKSREEPARWTPADSVTDHKRMLDYIDHVTRELGSYIMVGHHVPSELGVAPIYKGNLLNAAFRSDLDEFIEARPQIKMWVFGHTHFDFDFHIGATHLACNPRGYVGYEARTESFELKYFDV